MRARIGQPITTKVKPRAPASKSRLERAFEAASLLLNLKEDPTMAARVIDDALDARTDAPSPLVLGRASYRPMRPTRSVTTLVPPRDWTK